MSEQSARAANPCAPLLFVFPFLFFSFFSCFSFFLFLFFLFFWKVSQDEMAEGGASRLTGVSAMAAGVRARRSRSGTRR